MQPISKLMGVSPATRAALKRHHVNTCPQLLRAAGPADRRARLARETGLDPGEVLSSVRHADMARVDGLGAVYGMMVEGLGVGDLPALAAADPAELHARLRTLNAAERIARRSPTSGEVVDWVRQAHELPPLVGY